MMKNGFYCTLKALFVLEKFRFLFSRFFHVGKRLDIKAKKKSKLDDTNLVANNYLNDILSDISISEGNQTMKFVQLVEYNKKYFS